MLFLSFFLGFSASYIGSITPSMLNITATKISLEKGKKTATQFAFGVSFIVLFQAFIGLFFLKTINQNPVILETIQKVATVIFIVLSIVFFRKAIQKQQEIPTQKPTKNGFLTGAGLSTVNMFSIPFFCGVAAVFKMYNWLELELLSIIIFSVGSSLGTFLILYNYVSLAEKIRPKIAKFSTFLNYVLSAITGIVAIISLIKML